MSGRLARVSLIVIAPVALRAFLTGFVDEIDADGYSGVLIAERIAESFRSGAFNWGLLYVPAWMPAWHLVCAAAQLLVSEPYYVPKLLSALFGGLSPALVFLITRRLSPRERTAWIAWGITAVLPLHVFYSATAMSEPFSGFWILLAVLALLRSRPDNRSQHASPPSPPTGALHRSLHSILQAPNITQILSSEVWSSYILLRRIERRGSKCQAPGLWRRGLAVTPVHNLQAKSVPK